MRILWERPRESADGRSLYDLGGFHVERRDSGTFSVVGKVAVDDAERVRPRSSFSFLDTEAPAGAAFYRVRAFLAGGQFGDPSPAVEVGAAGPGS